RLPERDVRARRPRRQGHSRQGVRDAGQGLQGRERQARVSAAGSTSPCGRGVRPNCRVIHENLSGRTRRVPAGRPRDRQAEARHLRALRRARLYPLDTAVDLSAPDASLQIFRNLEAMMDASDAIIANLTPFRGPGADPGTVYELGYMA